MNFDSDDEHSDDGHDDVIPPPWTRPTVKSVRGLMKHKWRRCTYCNAPLLRGIEQSSCCNKRKSIVTDDEWPRCPPICAEVAPFILSGKKDHSSTLNNALAFAKLQVQSPIWKRRERVRDGDGGLPQNYLSGFTAKENHAMTLGGRTFAHVGDARQLQRLLYATLHGPGDEPNHPRFYPYQPTNVTARQPTRRSAEVAEEESDMLARYCWVLQLFLDYLEANHPMFSILHHHFTLCRTQQHEVTALRVVVHPDDNRHEDSLGSISTTSSSWFILPRIRCVITPPPSRNFVFLNNNNFDVDTVLARDAPQEVLLYPLFLPHGVGGFFASVHVPKYNSIRDFFKRVVMQRYFDAGLGLFPRLFEQFVLDIHARVESIRYEQLARVPQLAQQHAQRVRIKRARLREMLTSGQTSDADFRASSRTWSIPASVPYSPAWNQEKIDDGMAVANCKGSPSVFQTLTFSFADNELIKEAFRMIYGDGMPYEPDARMFPMLTVRAFRAALSTFEKSLKARKVFPFDIDYIQRCLEWQRSGLTHAHLMIRFKDADLSTASAVDEIVSARRFVPELCSSGCSTFDEHCSSAESCMAHQLTPLVDKFNIHTCGAHCRNERGTCKRNFPFAILEQSYLAENGRWLFRRGRGDELVVPYNPVTLLMMRAHTHIDVCSSAGCTQYMRKYIAKLPDSVRIQVERNDSTTANAFDSRSVSAMTPEQRGLLCELRQWEKVRFCCSAEALTRLLGYTIQLMLPAVTRLSVTLPDDEYISGSTLPEMLSSFDRMKDTQLNRYFVRSALLDHVTFPRYYEQFRLVTRAEMMRSPNIVAHCDNGIQGVYKWAVRRARNRFPHVVRVRRISQRNRELYCLRLLLTETDICGRSVDDYKLGLATFVDAAKSRGLFDDDNEPLLALQELISHHVSPAEWERHHLLGTLVHAVSTPHDRIRGFFATLLLQKLLPSPTDAFNLFWPYVERDLPITTSCILPVVMGSLPPTDPSIHSRKRALDAVAAELKRANVTLDELGFSDELMELHVDDGARDDESARNRDEHLAASFTQLADEQQDFIRRVELSITTNAGYIFHLQGDAGTGKTTTVQVLLARLRLEGCVCVVSSFMANAARLLVGGDTCHRHFGLPVVDSLEKLKGESSSLDLRKRHGIRLRSADLIVVDEVSMLHQEYFRIMREGTERLSVSSSSWNGWAGKTVVLLGDFKQLGPVVDEYSNEEDISPITATWWNEVARHTLTDNFRLRDQRYLQWVNKVGNGIDDAGARREGRHQLQYPSWLQVVDTPSALHDTTGISRIAAKSPTDLMRTRVIAYTHERCNEHNVSIARMVKRTLDHNGTLRERECNAINAFLDDHSAFESLLRSEDFLRMVEHPSLPPSRLDLFVGCIVVLTRNINSSTGAVNGVRGTVVDVSRRFSVTLSLQTGEIIDIPRIIFIHTQKETVAMSRKQFPLRIGYATTVNKVQGATIAHGDVLAFDMRGGSFAHGHAYVAFSRVTSATDMYVLRESTSSTFTNIVNRTLVDLQDGDE